MIDTILGIDVGTSSIKCGLYDTRGREILSSSNQYILIKPSPGIMEIEPERLWLTVAKTVSEITKKNNGKYKIVAIGLCAMMIMPVFLDCNNDVIRPIIHWLDERLGKQCIEIKKSGTDKILTQYSGSVITGESTINAISWLKKYEPESYKKINKFIMIKDYIRFRLTGKILSDYGDASGSLMLNTRNWEWSKEIISAFKLNIHIFPELHSPSDIGGYIIKEASVLTGLQEGIPVAVGSGDGITTIFGLGVYNNGDTGITVGSAGVIGTATNKYPNDDNNRISVTCHPFGDRWFSLMSTAASGEVLRWYKNSIVKDINITYDDLYKEAQKAPPGTDSLIFLPYILGSRFPHSNPRAVGMFLGLRHKYERSYLTRALMEGISLELLDILNVQHEILKNISIIPKNVFLSGGIVKSSFWTQLLSDVLQENLITTEVKELGTLGASVIAAYSVSIYDNLEKAVQCMIKKQNIINYDKELKAVYEKKYSIFKDIYCMFENKWEYFNS